MQENHVHAKILICSHAFDPSVGGIETVTALVATALVEAGHEVRLVTQTPGRSRATYPFLIYRQPSASKLIGLWKWSEVVLQSNISLRTLWPRLFFSRRVAVVTHTWIARPDGSVGWNDRLKMAALRCVVSAAVSRALAERLGKGTQILPDPYDDAIFRQIDGVERNRDVVFVGRLVSDKGADLLVKAIAWLRDRGHKIKASIIGSGPEEASLRVQCQKLKLEEQVQFCGSQYGMELARQLNAHKILAVPSRWQEPFGIVALEGIACGCVVVGSNLGGLPEAIGDCGLTFSNGDVKALAIVLLGLMENPGQCTSMRKQAVAHLSRFTRDSVLASYLKLLGLNDSQC